MINIIIYENVLSLIILDLKGYPEQSESKASYLYTVLYK